MTAKYSITMYCPRDGQYIAKHMRDNDVFECRAAGHATPEEAIDTSVEESVQAWTFCYGNVPLCVFGYVPDTAGGAIFWLLGTDEIKRHKREFMRRSKLFKGYLMKNYEYLTNVVCMDNHESVRWLKWLGAEFCEESAVIMGKPFQRFYVERSDG